MRNTWSAKLFGLALLCFMVVAPAALAHMLPLPWPFRLCQETRLVLGGVRSEMALQAGSWDDPVDDDGGRSPVAQLDLCAWGDAEDLGVELDASKWSSEGESPFALRPGGEQEHTDDEEQAMSLEMVSAALPVPDDVGSASGALEQGLSIISQEGVVEERSIVVASARDGTEILTDCLRGGMLVPVDFLELFRRSADTPPADAELLERCIEICDTSRVSSMKILCERVKCDIRQLKKLQRRLAMLALHVERCARACLERELVSKPDVRPLLYIDVAMYDETPLRVRTKEGKTQVSEPSNAAHDDASPGTIGALPRWAQACVGSDSGAAKLFQTQGKFGMVFRIGSALVSVRGCSNHSLQILDRTTAKVLHRALVESSMLSASCEEFPKKLRVAISDRYSANKVAEHAILSGRPGWDGVSFFCEAHLCSGAQSKTFELIDPMVSHLINWSLSLAHGTSMRTFRQSLKHVIATKLVVLHGAPSDAAVKHRSAAIDLYLARGAHRRVRMATLEALANGDWRRTDRVEHYSAPGIACVEADIVEDMVNHLAFALCHSQPPVWPRHRWTRADEAADYVGLLQAVHGLATHAYTHWLQEHHGLPMVLRQEFLELALDISDEATEDGGGGLQSSAGSVGGHPGQGGDDTWQAQNERHRKLGLRFVLDPMGIAMMPLLRIVLEPFRVMLRDILALSGTTWELRERSKAVKATQASGSIEAPAQRTFRLQIAARGELEVAFKDHTQYLMEQSEAWEAVNPETRTEEVNTLAFRLLSRAACVVEEKIAKLHRACPIQTLRILDDPSLIDVFRALPECMQDGWTHGLLREGVDNDTILAHLDTLASLCPLDISSVEVGHGRVRRRVMAASHHGRLQEVDLASAAWVLSESKRRKQEVAYLRGKGAGSKQSGASTSGCGRGPLLPIGAQQTKPKTGGGGPCRAYMATLAGQNLSLREMHESYKELTEEDKQRLGLYEMGAAMKKAHRKGLPSVKMSVGRIVERAEAKKAARLRSERIEAAIGESEDKSSRALALVPAMSARSSIGEHLSVVRAIARTEAQIDKHEERSLANRVAEYVSQQEPAMLANVQGIPSLSPQSGNIVSCAPSNRTDIDWMCPAPDVAARLLSALSPKVPRQQAVLAALDLEWDARHTELLNNESEVVPPVPKATRCIAIGLCVCVCAPGTGRRPSPCGTHGTCAA